jgi:uncharacterized membrane protein YdjX (TVP38/TMEM64 family)
MPWLVTFRGMVYYFCMAEPNQNTNDARKNWVRLAVLAGIIILGIVLIRLLGLQEYLSLKNLQELSSTVKELGWIGPVVYILIWIVACLFFLPGSPITIAGSIVFGAWWALPLVTIGANLGANAAFLAARYAARPMVENWAEKNHQFKKIDDGVQRHGWRMVMITRLVPIFPFNLQNYAYGLTKVKFSTYALVSLACMIPGTAAYVFAGGALVSGKGDLKTTLAYLAVAAIMFVIVSLIPGFLKKRYSV